MTPDRLAAEERARVLIDRQLADAGWHVQSSKGLNLFAGPGVAVREAVMAPGHGRADYLLYVDHRVVGVIEAKPVGTTLAGVEWQSAVYAEGLRPEVRLRSLTHEGRLPFVLEASGTETWFTNGFDPDPRARRLFAFPRPETLAQAVRDAEADPDAPTWRAKVRALPTLDTTALRPAQIDAVSGIERALAEQRFDRSLVQMATGAGKTYTAVTECYRLLAFGGFRRVLFLVDRINLAKQTLAEFQNYRTPGDGRRFTELYPVDLLTSGGMLASSSVVISTIQRVHSVLKGQPVTDADDPELDAFTPDAPVSVEYCPALPPETFDLVIVDEAHRSIYGVWRGVLEYFDAHVVGLTATPGKQTFAFFRQNLVSEYTYPQSVADRVNVDFDVYRIATEISENGSVIEAGTIVPKVDRRTRVQRLEALEEDLDYAKGALDRAVTAKRIPAALAHTRYEIHRGDLLVSRANTHDYVGASVLVRETPDRLLLSDKSLRIVPQPGISTEWLWRALSSPASRSQLSANATGTKESMRNISQSALLEVRVPDPATRDQEADVASLREVEAAVVRLSDELRASAQRLASLRRAVLAAAFSGRLTGSGSDDEVVEETAATLPAPAASDMEGDT